VTYQIDFTPAARRQFLGLAKTIQKRIAPRVDALATEPRPPGVKKLQGEADLYRIRVGDWRIVYAIRDKALLVLVVRVANRRDVYR
jgi:mRNA interferase RelE/StbE